MPLTKYQSVVKQNMNTGVGKVLVEPILGKKDRHLPVSISPNT